ncbi:MAG: enoyl-CoA hydratase/isomerase family protein [Pararhodobacter sp.]|nr:enoyl-CoA hydratase/isomerase family protein [Pararhodobacter sp.]
MTRTARLVRLEHDGAVARVTLANPARCNALTVELLADLADLLDSLDAPRALVLLAEGRHFSTGGDVARLASEVAAGNGPAHAQALVGALNAAILKLAALPCPVLAGVQGALTGGALGLVLAADLVAMTPDAFVQPWYAAVGFAPDGGWTAMLPSRIGMRKACSLQMLNTRLGAADALALGLADAVTDTPEAQIAAWLSRILAHDPGTLADTRRLSTDLPALAAALEAERAAFVARIASPGARAGMDRFLSARSI